LEESKALRLHLIIGGLDLDQIRLVAGFVRELWEKEPGRIVGMRIQGLEKLPVEEVKKLMHQIFLPGQGG